MPTLSVIIVSWNVCDLLRRALTSVYASWGAGRGLEVIVVDNNSRDGSAAMVQSEFPQARLIHSENRGYGAAGNQGLAIATGELLLVLNPDIEVLDDALPRLADYAQTHPDAGMIGPHLLWPDGGGTQSSRRRFPTLPILFLESTWLEWLLPRKALQRYYLEDRPDDAPQDVDWITGAAMLTRRAVFETVGGFDESFFMYSEELDWCRRVKTAGWRVHYCSGARIVHHEGKSSEQVVAARHIYFQSSKVSYTRKYHGPLIAEILRAWLMIQYIWQVGVEGAKWLAGHRRDLRKSRMAAYKQVLKSRLRQPVSPANQERNRP